MIRPTRFALLLLLSVALTGFARAQTPDPCNTAPQTCATTINTRGSASKRLVNSVVDVTVGISATNKEMAGSQRQLAQQTNTLLAYLRSQKVERLITNNINVEPQMQSEKNAPERIVGYSASSSVSFRTSPEKAPDVLTGALNNGANQIESTVFTPTEDEVRSARRELSAEAVRTAIAQANAIAKAAEMHVVGVRSINVEDQGSYFPRPMALATMKGMFKNDGPPPPISTAAGDQEITVSVNVVVAARP